MGRLIYFTKFPQNILLLILVLSFSIRVYNLNYNSPFLDEAQYIVLGEKVLAGHWKEANPFSWVGGMPLFYPALSAAFGTFGIVGSRFLNVILGTLSIYLVYEFTKNLRFSKKEQENEITGLVAGGFLGVLAVPMYLSRLAIYDMLSFTLFLLGLLFFINALALKKPTLWEKENRFSFAAAAFAASFFAKYIVLILLPFITVLGLWYTKGQGKKEFMTYLKYFVALLAVFIGGYAVWQFNALLHFQTEQVSTSENQSLTIIRNFFTYSLPALIPAIAGAILLFIQKQKTLPIVLFVLAFVTPIVHVVTNNSAASVQHVFLPLIFLMPLAAYGFLFIIRKWHFAGNVAVTIMLTGILVYSYSQLRALESEWPNTNAVMDFIKKNTTNHEKVLSSQDDITVLALSNLKDENITGIYTFAYKNKLGPEAYRLALEEDHFDFVLLNDHDHQEVEKVARDTLTSHYTEVYNKNPFIVYRLNKK